MLLQYILIDFLLIYIYIHIETFLLAIEMIHIKKSEVRYRVSSSRPRLISLRVNRVYACRESPVHVGRPASLMV